MLGARMQAEIEEQPAALRANSTRYFEELRPLAERKYRMVLLAARGSSDNAALYARYLIEVYLGVPVSLAAPSVLTRYGARVAYSECLAIGISQSGAAPDVAEVLEALRDAGHATLAITNTPDSRITRVAETSLLLGAGPERSVAATKTYSASLLALLQLVRALGASLPEPALPEPDWIDAARRAAESEFGRVARGSPGFVLARGFSYCSAQETALKLMECALLPAKSYSSADFQHGPRALAGPGSVAVIFGEAPEGLERQGCAVVPAPVPPVEPAIAPLWEIAFGQWLALLAARGRGLDPDAPGHLTKVTETF